MLIAQATDDDDDDDGDDGDGGAIKLGDQLVKIMMMVLFLKSLIMMMAMKMFLIVLKLLSFYIMYHDDVYHIEFGQPSSPTFVNIQPGPACKEALANLSGSQISCTP